MALISHIRICDTISYTCIKSEFVSRTHFIYTYTLLHTTQALVTISGLRHKDLRTPFNPPFCHFCHGLLEMTTFVRNIPFLVWKSYHSSTIWPSCNCRKLNKIEKH